MNPGIQDIFILEQKLSSVSVFFLEREVSRGEGSLPLRLTDSEEDRP